MRQRFILVIPALVATAVAAQAAAPEAQSSERGRYLVTIMDCGGCHTGGALAGKPDPQRYLAGSEIGFGGSAPMGEMTGGVVYPSNLTPDKETGLGNWTDEEIIRALRQGLSRDGRPLVPVMPWPSFAALTDADTGAIVAYLRSIPPIKFHVPEPVKPGEKATHPYLGVIEPKR